MDYLIERAQRSLVPQRVDTPLALHPAECYTLLKPKGVTLIISPWNYPFYLVMNPLIASIAAGNTAIVKPSEHTPRVAALIADIVQAIFPQEWVAVIQGDGSVLGPALIEHHRFDHIFFTGSTKVGKAIATMAAQHLSPVTLELGGKSPTIVAPDAKIQQAARRIAWGKCMNAGQTCIAPDYALVHRSVLPLFISSFREAILAFYGEHPLQSPDLARIIHIHRFHTLCSYMDQGAAVVGGESDTSQLAIAPTLLTNVSLDAPVMNEEIFGPILPVIPYDHEEEILPIIRRNRYPLALYIFSSSRTFIRRILENAEYGGATVNDVIMHVGNPHLPFGGIGHSGIGNYHGKYSIETFSHKAGVHDASTLLDMPLKYPPYTSSKEKWVKRILG
jgi:aldehyde dehydrogenase (NAD+)